MKRFIIFGFLSLVLILGGCGTSKQMAENKQNAEQFFSSGNYGEALSVYKQMIETYEINDNGNLCPFYTNAGISALNLGETKSGIDYLKKATYTQYANASTYLNLADAYKEIDNLSLEMLALEDVLNKYPESDEINQVKKRLLNIYVESDNYEKALDIWGGRSVDSISDISVLETYYNLNKGMDNEKKCEETAERMLVVDPENVTGLKYFGKKYYHKAEDLYQKEMEAYNKNKTNKQYRILLKALDQVTVDFKKSLTYFSKLYEVDPKTEYANYLSYIYNRLSDKKKADYYKGLAGE